MKKNIYGATYRCNDINFGNGSAINYQCFEHLQKKKLDTQFFLRRNATLQECVGIFFGFHFVFMEFY